jgi:cob(I)alamin adenosyltransferase
MVHSIQKDLFLAGSELASSAETLAGLKGRLGREDILGLEERIDQLTDRYGLPGHFVVPGESFESAFLHVARAVCRRCERSIVTLNAEQDGAHRTLIAYFNRLGDLLFVLAWALEVRTVVRRILEETLAHQPYREGTE